MSKSSPAQPSSPQLASKPCSTRVWIISNSGDVYSVKLLVFCYLKDRSFVFLFGGGRRQSSFPILCRTTTFFTLLPSSLIKSVDDWGRVRNCRPQAKQNQKKIALENPARANTFLTDVFIWRLLLQNIWPYAYILPDQSAEKLCQKPHSPQGKSFCLEAAGLLTYSISAPSQPHKQASGKRTETLISL